MQGKCLKISTQYQSCLNLNPIRLPGVYDVSDIISLKWVSLPRAHPMVLARVCGTRQPHLVGLKENIQFQEPKRA